MAQRKKEAEAGKLRTQAKPKPVGGEDLAHVAPGSPAISNLHALSAGAQCRGCASTVSKSCRHLESSHQLQRMCWCTSVAS